MMMMNQRQHQLEETSRIETSRGSEEPSWSANFRLLRSLYANWEPNDEILREVWFRCYDKPNGIGVAEVSHEDLRIAIVDSRQVNNWKEPDFERIAKFYRIKRQERIIKNQTHESRDQMASEREQCKREHERRIQRIENWTPERRKAAVNRVRSTFSMYRNDPGPPTEGGWSSMLSGMVVAADEEILNAC